MPFAELLGALRRRWILLIIGLLLTGGLTASSYMVTKPVYEITATVLLLPPASAVTAAGNPYLQLGGLRQTVDLMGVALSDQSTKAEMQAISKDVDYTVAADSQTSSPILVVDVKDSTPAGATRIRDLLVSRIPERLQSMQENLNVVAANRVTTTLLTSDNEAKEVGRNRLRSAVVVGLAALAVTFAFIALWDSRRPRKARPRKARVPLGAEEPRRAEEPRSIEETRDAEDHGDGEGPEEAEETRDFEDVGDAEEPADFEDVGDAEESGDVEDLGDLEDLGIAEEPGNTERSLVLITGGEHEDVEV